jgi:1-acyl-sn-glycerol-3-phosphate acyltransferase
MKLGDKVVYRMLWWTSFIVSKILLRMELLGAENLPADGSYIVSPVHRSNLDTPLIGIITKRRLRFMGKEALWKHRFLGWMLTAAGGFPVERGTADREALRACMLVVDNNEPLVMFPEGTRQSGPTLQDCFDGPAYVASRRQIPVVPVGIGGTEKSLSSGRKIPRFTKGVMIIGKPLDPPEANERGRVPRRAVSEFTEEIKAAIQEVYDEAQTYVGDPNIY